MSASRLKTMFTAFRITSIFGVKQTNYDSYFVGRLVKINRQDITKRFQGYNFCRKISIGSLTVYLHCASFDYSTSISLFLSHKIENIKTKSSLASSSSALEKEKRAFRYLPFVETSRNKLYTNMETWYTGSYVLYFETESCRQGPWRQKTYLLFENKHPTLQFSPVISHLVIDQVAKVNTKNILLAHAA